MTSPTKNDYLKIGIYIIIYYSVVIISAILFLPNSLFILWILIVALGLYLLVAWHARNFGYVCPNCNNEFSISTLVDFISPQGISKKGATKYLKCPKCHKWNWVKIQVKS